MIENYMIEHPLVVNEIMTLIGSLLLGSIFIVYLINGILRLKLYRLLPKTPYSFMERNITVGSFLISVAFLIVLLFEIFKTPVLFVNYGNIIIRPTVLAMGIFLSGSAYVRLLFAERLGIDELGNRVL